MNNEINEATILKELEKEWNDQAKAWAEKQAREEDFTLLATPLKPAEICRREFAYSIFKQINFKKYGGIPLRAFLLIDAEIEHVTASEEKAEEIRQQMQRGREKLQAHLEEHGPDSLNDPQLLEKLMLLDEECMEHLYLLNTKLFNEKRFTLFRDLSFFLVQLNPYIASYQINCGIAYQLEDELDEALYCYELASELNPNNPHAFLYAAECALKLNSEAKAIYHLEHMLLIEDSESEELPELKQYAQELISNLKARH